jgi:SAM-dependent methyltransferase
MRMVEDGYASINLNKANFDRIYHMPDPREYFRVLYGLDYVIPELSKTIFRSLIDACGNLRGRRLKILDIGCSYGINPALIRYPLDIQHLASRYGCPDIHALSPDGLAELDRHYFESWPEMVDADFVGLDASSAALTYAEDVGLIGRGVCADLESSVPDAGQQEALRKVDMIISTGCVGYVTEKSFAKILALHPAESKPWVASFVLRMFSYREIAAELERHGLVTEKLEGVTFVQRRFHSEQEFESTLATLREQGLDPSGKEADGLFHAELYLSRPESEVQDMPLSQMVSITSGASRAYGRRYRRLAAHGATLMP